MDRKQLLIAVSILLLVAAIYLFRMNRSAEMSNTESPTEKVTILNETNPKDVAPSIPPEKAAKLIAWSNSERKAFLKRTPLSVRDGKAQIKVSVSLLKRCEAGDLDAIRLDFKNDKQKRLKISFENLNSQKEVASFELPDNFFEKDKFAFQFSLPVGETPEQYGFFVCSTANTEKCSDKEVKDINDIFVEHYNNKNHTPKDRLYFFQFALVDNRGMAVFSLPPKGEQPFKEIEAYLQERGISSTVSKKLTEKSKSWTQTLGSLPVKFTADSIELEIPQYSEVACGQIPEK